MATCLYPGCKNSVLGRRQKRYCSNAHKQAHYRLTLKSHDHDKQTTAHTEELENALQRVDELEAEVKRLNSLLDIERRLRQDHTRRGFKAWIKKQPAANIGDLGKKIHSDAALPALGTRARYTAELRAHGYTNDELHQMDELWKLMLLQ